MKRFIEGEDRSQVTLLPTCLDDYVEAENPVRVVEVFVAGLDLGELGFVGVAPAATGRPAYHPAVLLKIYIYGYLNRIPSSRRLEREAQRNVELMWLTGRLAPDFKTIADFRRDNGEGIRARSLRVVKFLSRLLTALDLLPSTATVASSSSFISRHSRTNSRHTRRIAAPLSRRKSAIVLKSGASRPASQISSTLRWASRSSRRLDWMRFRYL